MISTVTIGGVGVAAGAAPDVTLHDVDGKSSGGERLVTPGQQINVNYTVDVGANTIVDEVVLTFENANTGETIERDLPDQEVQSRNETVAAPDAEGLYSVEVSVTNETGATDSQSFDDFLIVQTESPTVDIETPADGTSQMETPTIEGTAFDGTGIDNVTMSIENESGYYWNDSTQSWQSSETAFVVEDYTVSEGERVDWQFDFYDTIDQQGEYTVTVDAHDREGNSLGESGDVPTPDDAETPSVTFEWVMGAPSITGVTVTAPDPVEDGDEINLAVTVDERGANDVDAVTVDAPGLGITGATLPFASESSGTHTFDGNVTVSDPTAPEGDVTLTVTATEPSEGLEDTEEATVTLDRVPADVGSASIDAEFLGIVEDEAADSGIDVTVTDVTDAQGHSVDGQITVVVDGTTLETMSVTDGDPEPGSIDPTQIPNGSVDVDTAEIRADGQTIATIDVELVHYAYGLADGEYQAVGTPMESDDVMIDADLAQIERYDTADEQWEVVDDSAELTDAGTGYYVYAEGENPRIGYDFATDGVSETSPSERLQTGYNLVGASVQLDENADQKLSIENDLNHDSAKTINDSKVTVYTPASSDVVATEDDPADLDWSTAGGNFESTDVRATAGYWVYIEDGSMERTYETGSYDPAA